MVSPRHWCPNGHKVIYARQYCGLCGCPTVLHCEKGHPFQVAMHPYKLVLFRPDYCVDCGAEFPWSSAKVAFKG